MTVFNDNPDMWPMLLLLFLLGVAVFGAMVATNRAERLKDEVAGLTSDNSILKDQVERHERSIKNNIELMAGLRNDNRANQVLVANLKAQNGNLKEENGNLKLQVMALCKDVESLRSFNSDMHRVIDMDAKKLKDKERIIAEQQTKIDRLMKIRKK